MLLPKIHCLATGGTIAGAAESETATTGYQAGVVGVSALLAAVPALSAVAQLSGEQLLSLDSKNMSPNDWLVIALAAQKLLDRDDVEGLVITHGTDTLEETAFFLDLVLRTQKPVVMVAAMRPASALSADGPLNLFDAVCVAASRNASNKGVMVVMNHLIHSARDVSKHNTMRPDSFVSPNSGPIGMIQDQHVQWLSIPNRVSLNLGIPKELPRVDIVLAYAGVDEDVVHAYLSLNPQGLVIAGMGNGAFPESLRGGLCQAREKGIYIVRSSRTGSGYVMPNGDCPDDELQFLSAATLSPFKARVLLMLGIAHGLSYSELKKVFSFDHF